MLIPENPGTVALSEMKKLYLTGISLYKSLCKRPLHSNNISLTGITGFKVHNKTNYLPKFINRKAHSFSKIIYRSFAVLLFSSFSLWVHAAAYLVTGVAVSGTQTGTLTYGTVASVTYTVINTGRCDVYS